MAYYRVEPFGEDWLRTARAVMWIMTALGLKPDENIVDTFLPTYDPEREMTEDEINKKMAAWAARQQGR